MKFKERDKVVILSNRDGGKHDIGSVCNVKSEHTDPEHYGIESNGAVWYYSPEDIRMATASEINPT